VVLKPPTYGTKIWEGEAGSERLDVASKEYVRTEKERLAGASAGQEVKQVTGLEQYAAPQYYPAPVQYPVKVPLIRGPHVPLPSYGIGYNGRSYEYPGYAYGLVQGY
jgi:hypothetical protein